MGEGVVLLGFGHVRHGEEDQLLLLELDLGRSGLQIFFEGVGAGLVEHGVSFEVGVHVVDAEVDVEVELEFSGVLVEVPVLAGGFEELISGSFVEEEEEGVAIGFVAGVVVDVGAYFEVGSLGAEGVVGALVAVEEEVLLDELEELLVFVFEVGVGLVFFVEGEGLAVSVGLFGVGGGRGVGALLGGFAVHVIVI